MVASDGEQWKAMADDVTGAVGGVTAIRWVDNTLELLDQRALPGRTEYLRLGTVAEVADAIANMVVRGAPAIGVSAAYGVVLAARARFAEDAGNWRELIEQDLAILSAARPTAVNLAWALERMRMAYEMLDGDPEPGLLEQAKALHAQDLAANQLMGDLGARFIGEPCAVLTHCNAGALATAGYGTALGVIRSAYRDGKITEVIADETRPWLQGSRLTAWELAQDSIPVRLIADSAASYALAQGAIRWVIVGADRVAANGDVANKIGTYALAVSARHHGVGFMVVAPTSTIDLACPSGAEIPIEERPQSEVLALSGGSQAVSGVSAWNPVFDVTPASLVDVLVTEKGAVRQPDARRIAALFD